VSVYRFAHQARIECFPLAVFNIIFPQLHTIFFNVSYQFEAEVKRTATAENPTSPEVPVPSQHQIDPPQDIEEGRDVYRLEGFHPVYIGDVYNDRYKILNKIGYGAYPQFGLPEISRDSKLSS
jgi:hypothetical protein